MREGRRSCIFIAHNIRRTFQVVDRIAVRRRARIVADDIEPKQRTIAEVEAVITGELADSAHGFTRPRGGRRRFSRDAEHV
jgi:simple sugar transport system ATP-binding protein